MKRLAVFVLALLGGAVPIAALASEGDATDPARNLAIPCEYLSGPATAARSNRNISHVANVCGIVGTDVELQSRRDLNGQVAAMSSFPPLTASRARTRRARRA